MTYRTKDYAHLLGMDGFSDELLETHFSLYRGYVAETNRILEALSVTTMPGSDSSSIGERIELKRRLGREWNAMRLHELYFDNLGGRGSSADREPVDSMLRDQFGTVGAWKKDFETVATLRGAGWVVLYYDPRSRRLMNLWIDEHEGGHLSGCTPILVLDVFEHAYLLDHGLNRADYIEAFFEAVRWKEVARRFEEVALAELQEHDAAHARWPASESENKAGGIPIGVSVVRGLGTTAGLPP